MKMIFLWYETNPCWGKRKEIMKTSNEKKSEMEKDSERYITCPRCGARVSYQRRYMHRCFRTYMRDMRRDMARLDWAIRTW